MGKPKKKKMELVKNRAIITLVSKEEREKFPKSRKREVTWRGVVEEHSQMRRPGKGETGQHMSWSYSPSSFRSVAGAPHWLSSTVSWKARQLVERVHGTQPLMAEGTVESDTGETNRRDLPLWGKVK